MPTSSPQVAGIDHALVAVADLSEAEAAFARLGFTLSPRGRHIGWGTGNACAMFADGYVELLGVVDPAEFDNGHAAFLRDKGAGLMALALDPGADGVAAVAPDWPGAEPRALARLLELPEGTVKPEFRLLPLPPGALGPVPAFFTEHLTPHLLRQPAWLAHANTAQGLQSATWLVEDVATAVAPFIAWLGAEAVFRGIGRADIRLGRHTLYLLDPARAARRYPRVPLPSPAKGLVLTIRVADLDAAANCARAAGITPVPASGQRIVLPPEAGCGVIVEYCLG
jgi:catechol 2,3-dioxygenase-like lactoylglutathione lyase family enzyme